MSLQRWIALGMVLGSTAWAQDVVEAKLDPAGMVSVSRGQTVLATIDLNAHGPGWAHAAQSEATATVADLPKAAGKQFTGNLAIPKTDGGAIQYTQTVTALSQGFRLEYDLTMTKAMKLSGLQFSINLPVENHRGKEVVISPLYDDPRVVGLPEEQPASGRFQLWSGQGAKIEVAKGTPDAITAQLRAATDVVVQDLRQWEQPVFEIRLPAITEDAGHELAAGQKFHLDLTITFAGPVKLVGPAK